jgi:Rod binding domain-containing protein
MNTFETATLALNNTPFTAPNPQLKNVEEKAKEFEGMFLSQMLSLIFEGIDTDSTFGGGQGEKTFRSFMVTEYGKNIAATGQLGIADAVKTEMIRLQEEAQRK